MVIGDYDIDAISTQLSNRRDGVGATVARHHNSRFCFARSAHPSFSKVVAVTQTVGNERDYDSAARPECACQQRHRGDPIHVVIAVNENGFAGSGRADEPIDGNVQIG
jgi:hypothetical protein